jgi:hypothetical protein
MLCWPATLVQYKLTSLFSHNAHAAKAFDCKAWHLINSQVQQKRLCKFRKIFNSLVHRMLTAMKMLNFSLLFLYSHDNHPKEEILLHPDYHSNFGVMLY